MQRIILIAATLMVLALPSVGALAKDAMVDVANQDVEATDNRLAIAVALPAGVVGKRIDRAILEVPIAVGESADSRFDEFPLIELFEDGSELPKQTILLASGFDGIARFNVTRFVREWPNSDTREFVLGTVSESNATTFELGTASQWSNGIKARLVIEYSNRDGQSSTANAE
jgi:hypothetical protein